MISVQTCRKRYHQSMRQEQLSEIFNRARILLREISRQQAQQILASQLNHLLDSLLANDIKGIKRNLVQLHSVASQYYIVEYLMKQFQMPIQLEIISQGSFPSQCSIIDILLVLLNYYDQTLWEECSALLNCSLYQVRKMLQKSKINQYRSQIQRVLQNFPMHLLLDMEHRVRLNLLDSLQQVLQAQQNHEFIIIFLLKPRNFLSTIISLHASKHIISQECMQKTINISLMILFITSKYQLVNQEISQIANRSREMFISKIKNNQSSSLLFDKIRALSLSENIFEIQDMLIIQSILQQKIRQQNIGYIKMLNVMINTNQAPLLQQSFRSCLFYLFKQPSCDYQLQFQEWLAVLIFNNILLIQKNMFLSPEFLKSIAEHPNFVSFNQYQSILLLAKQRRRKLFSILLQMTWLVFQNYPQQLTHLHLSFLQALPQWKNLRQSSSLA